MTTEDKWDYFNGMNEMLKEFDSEVAPNNRTDWGGVIGNAIGDPLIGVYLNKQSTEGGDYAESYKKTAQIAKTDKSDYNLVKSYWSAGLSTMLDPAFDKKFGDFMADYAVGNGLLNGKGLTFVGTAKVDLNDIREKGVKSAGSAKQVRNFMDSGKAPFYIVEGSKPIMTRDKDSWFGSKINHGRLSETSFTLKHQSDFVDLADVMDKQSLKDLRIPGSDESVEEAFGVETLSELLEKYHGCILNAGNSFDTFTFQISFDTEDSVQHKRIELVDVHTGKPFELTIAPPKAEQSPEKPPEAPKDKGI